MKMIKRGMALFLCFLMLSSGPISAFATEGVSDNDVVVEISPTETTDTTVNDVGCPECRQIDVHLPICSHYEAISTVEETSDYSGDIGKQATFNEADTFPTFDIKFAEPTSLSDTVPAMKSDFSSDILFEITAYKVIEEDIGETLTTTLWYQVKIIQGTAPEEFLNEFWVLQKDLGSNYYQDVLILSPPPVEPPAPEEPKEVNGTVGGNTVTVSGNIPEDTQLRLGEVVISEIPGYDSETNFGIGDRPYIAMDISLLLGEEEYQPTESVSVTMGVSGVASAGEDVLVYHVHDNGDGTVVPELLGPFQVDENGKITFDMNSFSYVLVFNGDTKYPLESVDVFYPVEYESTSTNNHLEFVGIYYDTKGNVHFLLATTDKTPDDVESKFVKFWINNVGYRVADYTPDKQPVTFNSVTFEESDGTVLETVDVSGKGFFDVNVGKVTVERVFSFAYDQTGGEEYKSTGWSDEGDVTVDLDYKLVKTVAVGTSATGVKFTDSVNVERGDWVIYKIEINNEGTLPLTGMKVTDVLPADVFDMNTVEMSIDLTGQTNWQKFKETMFENYSSEGKFTNTLYIKAQVLTNLEFETSENKVYTNRATIDGMNMPTYEDTAEIIVKAPTTGTLTVSKAVTSENPKDPAQDTDFTFSIHSDAANAGYFNYTKTVGTTQTTGSIENNGTFTLKNGEYIEFKEFPVGQFTVTETEASGFTTKVNGKSIIAADGKIVYSDEMKGAAAPVVAFENQFSTRMATLTISKQVKKEYVNDEPEIPDEGFAFTVVFNDDADTMTEYTYTIGETTGTITSGGTIKLSDDQTAVFTNIPVGTSYTVTENLGDLSDDYKTTVNGTVDTAASGILPVGGATVEVVNTYLQHFTDLTITKIGANVDLDEHQSFIFDVFGPNGFEITVTINGNGSVTIKNLPFGEYTVTEQTEWSWRYDPEQKSVTKMLSSNPAENHFDFSNTRKRIYWLSGDSYCENWWGVVHKDED